MWRMPMMLLESGVSVTASDVMLLMSISSSACDIMASWWMCLNEWVMMSAAVSVLRFSWCCTARRISPSVIIPTQLLFPLAIAFQSQGDDLGEYQSPDYR